MITKTDSGSIMGEATILYLGDKGVLFFLFSVSRGQIGNRGHCIDVHSSLRISWSEFCAKSYS